MIEFLVNILSPILELQHAPLPPQSVASQGAHPTPSPSTIHRWTRSWVYQGAWGCVNIIEKHLRWQNIVQKLYKILN